MKAKLISIILISTVLFIAVTGCAQQSKNSTGVPHQTITDIYERKVDIPPKVECIATVGSATRICAYADIVDKLVAVTDADKENISRPYTIAYKDKLANLPTTNNGNHLNSTTVNKEQLLQLKPDVILSTRSEDECNKLQEDTNIPVVGIYFQDEIFSDKVYNSIKIAGQIVGKTTEVDKTINYLKETKNDLDERAKKIKNRTKIYRGAVNYKGSKGITGTISNYCVYQNINVDNVADNPNINGAYDTSMEQIIAWNPGAMFFDCTNADKITTEEKDTFPNIPMFYVAPFNNNGTNIEYGLCEMYFTGKTLYPEAFADVNLNDKFDQIFDKMLGKKIYQELNAKGINFGKAN
ncbi:MAG: ABC transporter substrate-binding protein [Coriobacteriia bacterium]|nr:ABC transporter substrate-binding protein [Coriobacteriia bacterium]